jgi:hypothetical protein
MHRNNIQLTFARYVVRKNVIIHVIYLGNFEVFTLPHQFLVESSGFLRIPRNEPGMNQNWRI